MKSLFKSKMSVAFLSIVILTFLSADLFAYSSGITGRTLKSSSGCTCHSSVTPAVVVTITGADSLTPNMQSTYTVTIKGGPLVAGGIDIAVSAGTLAIVTSDLQLSSSELTHTSPKLAASGAVTFQFKYTAPASLGTQTIYATGLSANNTGGSSGDQYNNAPNKTVTVVASLPVELTSFTAAAINNSVDLKWETATELNNSGFRIERKTNNSAWDFITFIRGAGNSTAPKSYSYTDASVSGKNLYSYRLIQIDNNGQMSYSKETEINVDFIPASFSLEQNFPNPFNPSTTIVYNLPQNSFVSLKVYNAIGLEVAVLVNETQSADIHRVSFDASRLGSGIYYYSIKAGSNFSQTKKMIVLK